MAYSLAVARGGDSAYEAMYSLYVSVRPGLCVVHGVKIVTLFRRVGCSSPYDQGVQDALCFLDQ